MNPLQEARPGLLHLGLHASWKVGVGKFSLIFSILLFTVESRIKRRVLNHRNLSAFFLEMRLTSISMAAAPTGYFGISTVVRRGSK